MITEVIRNDAQETVLALAETLHPLGGASVLVTGASGFLGSFFLDVLAAFNQMGRPCRLIAADNRPGGLPPRLAHLAGRDDFTYVARDVAAGGDWDGVPDYIIHCAGIASPIHYRSFPLETIAVNVDGTRNMLELARKGTRSMLSFSSSEIYGDPAIVPTPEDYRGFVSCTGPRACYDESKRMNETLCVTYFRQFGTPVKIIRPFNVFGPGQRLDDGRIIPDLMNAALAGGPLVLFSDGRATRSFCYVADFVHACLLVMMSDADGEPVNVGNDHEVSIGETARLVAEVAATPPLTVDYRVSTDGDYLVDNPQRRCPDLTKLRRLTGWAPRVDLREGLRRTFLSYRMAEAAARPAPADV